MRSTFFVFILLTSVIYAADQSEQQGPSAANRYTEARIGCICQHIQEIWLARASGDTGTQVQMLRHLDPWIRAYAMHRLISDTNFTGAWRRAQLKEFDPWSEPKKDADDVSTFVEELKNTPGALHYRDGLPEKVRQSGVALSAQAALERLVYFAGRELRRGNRTAADLLVALLDDEIPAVQANALRTLIPRTEFKHTRQDLAALNPRSPDVEFLARIRQGFLIWWENNSATYLPEPKPPNLPR